MKSREDKNSWVGQVGKQVRRYRRALKWTQAMLAERADISINYIGAIERAQADVTLQTLSKIADALGISPVELFGHCQQSRPLFVENIKRDLENKLRKLSEDEILMLLEFAEFLELRKKNT